MLEALVEDWLDNINERGYQAAFCNLLLADGYQLVHDTRHTPIEFGKDIIARAPDGVVCAFQLKGASSGHFSLGEWRKIEAQLFQLATYALEHPNCAKVPPQRSYLVVNAEADEDVHRAMSDLNATITQNIKGSEGIRLWGKSQFRSSIQNHLSTFFPARLASFSAFLRAYSSQGDGLFELEGLSDVFDEILDTSRQPSAADARRRLLTAHIVTSIATRPYFEKSNYYGVVQAFAYLAIRSIGYSNKIGRAVDARLIDLVQQQIVNMSLALFVEAKAARRLGNRTDGLSGAVLIQWRRQQLGTLFSALDLSESVLDESTLTSMRDWIDKNTKPFDVWGEAALPEALIHYWWLHNTKAGLEAESFLAQLLQFLIQMATSTGLRGLPSTYITFPRVAEFRWSMFVGASEDGEIDDWCKFRSQFAYPLFLLLARTNAKQTCKIIWPDLVKVSCEYTKLDRGADFAELRVEEATRQSDVLPDEIAWEEVLHRAKVDECLDVPPELFSYPLLLLLYMLLMPYRATPSVVLKASRTLIRTWY